MIRLRNISKTYISRKMFSTKKLTHAVQDLDLDIPTGGFGLLGLNGAGKTTTIKMMCTLLNPSKGNIKLDGFDVVKDAHKIRPKINMITGSDRMLYFRLTGRENLRYFAALYGMGDRASKKRADELLEFINLKDAADERVERYSRGMKQRLSIARGLINNPSWLFLDEPTLGLDVHIAEEIRRFIREKLLGDPNRTVVLTSHYMKEVEELCPSIGILKEGRLVYSGSPEELSRSLGLKPKHKFNVPSLGTELKNRIHAALNQTLEYSHSDRVEFTVESDHNPASDIIKILNEMNISDIQYQSSRPDLEEAILKLEETA
jgi:ABC-2 type transport system ATP-binding protein